MRNHLLRAARVAYAFVIMNVVAIKAFAAYVTKREVWR